MVGPRVVRRVTFIAAALLSRVAVFSLNLLHLLLVLAQEAAQSLYLDSFSNRRLTRPCVAPAVAARGSCPPKSEARLTRMFTFGVVRKMSFVSVFAVVGPTTTDVG